jgi:hypothetical protein
MGYAISWIAAKGDQPERLVQSLGLKPTGDLAEYAEAQFTGCKLQSGWFVVVINEYGHPFMSSQSLASLSTDNDIVACAIEEHVMVCTAEEWRNGRQIWRLEHDAQQSMEHISASGQLPEVYASIEQASAEQQAEAGGKKADVDYFFEIPVETAKNIVGFKHDEAGLSGDRFEILETDPAASQPVASGQRTGKPWWKIW